MPEETPIERKVVNTFPKGHDLELHLSRVTVGPHVWYELRDFVPSKNVYMRCVTVPIEMLEGIGMTMVDVGVALRKRKASRVRSA